MSSSLETQSGFAPSGDTQIYFETAGSGPPLLFLRAGSSMRDVGCPVRYVRTPFSRRSLRPSRTGQNRADPHALMLNEDLLSVMRHLGIARAVLVGCSMGGTTAVDCALAYPDMVDALVLSGPGSSGWTWSPEIVKLLTEAFRRIGAGDIGGARQLNARLWLDSTTRSAIDRSDILALARAHSIPKTTARALDHSAAATESTVERAPREKSRLRPWL